MYLNLLRSKSSSACPYLYVLRALAIEGQLWLELKVKIEDFRQELSKLAIVGRLGSTNIHTTLHIAAGSSVSVYEKAAPTELLPLPSYYIRYKAYLLACLRLHAMLGTSRKCSKSRPSWLFQFRL